MSLLKRIKPTLVFDGKHIENQINYLNNLTNLNEEGELLREKELKFLSIGLYGENQILFELLKLNGFGKYKVEKYGKDILDIINKGVGFYER